MDAYEDIKSLGRGAFANVRLVRRKIDGELRDPSCLPGPVVMLTTALLGRGNVCGEKVPHADD